VPIKRPVLLLPVFAVKTTATISPWYCLTPLAATLAVIMTDDPVSNQIEVYDLGAKALLKTLSTHGWAASAAMRSLRRVRMRENATDTHGT
jgi:hypothetical protein